MQQSQDKSIKPDEAMDTSGAASSQDSKRITEHLEETANSPLKVLRRPEEPTSEERQKHEVDHLPYALWCR
eukprot:12417289-Karenia_brevis.AAC.1